MYLSGSGPHLRRGRRRNNPYRAALLVVLIGSIWYFYKYVVPAVPPPFLPTPTVTRNPASYVEEAEAKFAAGKLQESIDTYQRAIGLDPTNLDYYTAKARIQVFAGDHEDALQTADDAVLLNPNSAKAHAVRGWALAFYPDRQEEALAAVVQALQLDPGLPQAHAYLAEIYADQGKWEDAAFEARKSLELGPNLIEAHRAMAYVYELTGNYPEAIGEYRRALGINSNLAMLYKALGKNYALGLGDVSQAIDNYLKAITLDPKDAQVRSLVAQAYASEGEYGKASQYAEQAVELVPAEPKFHGQLGLMYYHNQEYAPAIRELFLATQGGTYPDADGQSTEVPPLALDYGRVAEYYYTLGLALVKTGKCDQAQPILEAVLATVPDDEIAVFNAAEGLRMCAEAAYATEAFATQAAATPKP